MSIIYVFTHIWVSYTCKTSYTCKKKYSYTCKNPHIRAGIWYLSWTHMWVSYTCLSVWLGNETCVGIWGFTWSYVCHVYDNHIRTSIHHICDTYMMLIYEQRAWMKVYIYYSHMIHTYATHAWLSCVILTYDTHIWVLYILTYDSHICGTCMIYSSPVSHMMFLHHVCYTHIWYTYMIHIYELHVLDPDMIHLYEYTMVVLNTCTYILDSSMKLFYKWIKSTIGSYSLYLP